MIFFTLICVGSNLYLSFYIICIVIEIVFFIDLFINCIRVNMSNQLDTASHCVVQWEDNHEQYAIVDTKRSKAVSTLKVGLTTCFEGYQRERRRGKILYLGKFSTI